MHRTPSTRVHELGILDHLAKRVAAHFDESGAAVVAHLEPRAIDLDVLDGDVVAHLAGRVDRDRLIFALDDEGSSAVPSRVAWKTVAKMESSQFHPSPSFGARIARVLYSPWVVKTWLAAEKKTALSRLMVAPGQSSTTVPGPP